MSNSEFQPVFSHAEPVLAVENVSATIAYWQTVLGFPSHWTWGEPPTHGAVSWHGAHIQFYDDPKRAKASAGNTVWMRLKYIDQLYQLHQERKADIVSPLQHQPWGMDQYVVKEVNGYFLAFAGHSAMGGKDKEKSGAFPEEIEIVDRTPTDVEFSALSNSVGWTDFINEEGLAARLAAPAFGAVAVHSSGKVVGCVLILTDYASFYYVKDLMVHPDWQKRRIGTALMHAAMRWVDLHAVSKNLVGLYTGENLEPFYRQFGFTPAFGMVKRM